MGKKSRRPGRANRDRDAKRVERSRRAVINHEIATHENLDGFAAMADMVDARRHSQTPASLWNLLQDDCMRRRLLEVAGTVEPGDVMSVAEGLEVAAQVMGWCETLEAFDHEVSEVFMQGSGVTIDDIEAEGVAALAEVDERIWHVASRQRSFDQLLREHSAEEIAEMLLKAQSGVRKHDALDAQKKAKRTAI